MASSLPREHKFVTPRCRVLPYGAASFHNLHGSMNGGPLVQFLDYLVAALLLSCAAAVGWMIFFFPA